ncbi:Uncharacterised protein [Pseudomonas aeruginosa]|nr:Uncharacterised protein [Pseudomonas aeruginosa]
MSDQQLDQHELQQEEKQADRPAQGKTCRRARSPGHRLPQRLPPRRLLRGPAETVRRQDQGRAGSRSDPGQGGRSDHAQPRFLHRPPGQQRAPAGLRQPQDPAGRNPGRDQDLGPGRHHRRRRRAGPLGQGRPVRRHDQRAPADQVAASAAGQAPWPDRHRAALPPALRRPDGQRGNPPHLPRAFPGHRPHPPFPQRARFPRSGDPDAADHPRRRRGQAVRDPSQRAGHGHVPAHRPGAVPQAPGGRRFREGLRDQPQLP